VNSHPSTKIHEGNAKNF